LEKHAKNYTKSDLGINTIYQINKVLKQYFRDIILNLNTLSDPRKSKQYGIDEIAMSGISMFLFNQDSRNAYNLNRQEEQFTENYQLLFNMELAHMDSVDDVFRVFDTKELEKVKADMISKLIRGKVFADQRYNGKYIIAVDGTGVVSFDKPHCDCCLTKTVKGKTTYFHNVLEAKLITSSGFALSIASEWINNEGKTNFDKQDCEREAFKRMSEKIKQYFPRLPIIIVADGLYPYQGFFEICKKNLWNYVLTLQDGNLKSLQEEIPWEKRITPNQNREVYSQTTTTKTSSKYHWLTSLKYKDNNLNWVECNEVKTNIKTQQEIRQRFVYITDLPIGCDNYNKISNVGRLRQKVENEGFNVQKNFGYNLQHKFARKSFNSMKNFYQCLQIAHIINQLVINSKAIAKYFKANGKFTVKHLWRRLISFFLERNIPVQEMAELTIKPYQIRLL
jgi:hypothetical protein